MVAVKQNVAVCLLVSVASGVFNVLATAALAYPDFLNKTKGREFSLWFMRGATVANVVLQMANTAANMVAAWFGPVSIVVPTVLSAQVVANMLLFGGVLRIEKFTKEMRGGTYNVALATVLLSVVGPKAQEDQDILELLEQPWALGWTALLTVLMFASALLITCVRLEGLSSFRVTALLLVAQVVTVVLRTTLSKMLVLVSGVVLYVTIGIFIVGGAIQTYAIYLQALAVEQATFVPMMATGNMLVNAITGLVVWEDWRVIQSWLGYACVFLLLLLGNYMLSSHDVFQEKQVVYGRAQSVALVAQATHQWTSEHRLRASSLMMRQSTASAPSAVGGAPSMAFPAAAATSAPSTSSLSGSGMRVSFGAANFGASPPLHGRYLKKTNSLASLTIFGLDNPRRQSVGSYGGSTAAAAAEVEAMEAATTSGRSNELETVLEEGVDGSERGVTITMAEATQASIAFAAAAQQQQQQGGSGTTASTESASERALPTPKSILKG